MSSLAIEITNLRFRWPKQNTECLAIPHWQVFAGETVFLHGQSGSGKSTLLALLGGVACPQSGSIRLMGQEFSSQKSTWRDRFRADHIGFIFQQFNLLPWLSAWDNVVLSCEFSNLRKQQAIDVFGSVDQQARTLLMHLDLAEELWYKLAGNLSVGQQQRVAVARALMGKPALIVADEPTSSLDAKRQKYFIDLLLNEIVKANSTLLFVSHDTGLAEHFNRQIALPSINQADENILESVN